MARAAKKETPLTTEEKLAKALVPEEEQPYPVPGNWCWVRLGTVIESVNEKTDIFDQADLKYVGLENIEKDTGKIEQQPANEIKSTKNVFREGDILYGKLRPYLNKHGIVSFSGVCSTDILVFRAKLLSSNKLVDYFFYLPNFIEYAVANSKGINLPRVSEKIVLQASFPLPPLPEQHRIVTLIESLFADLDAAKEKLQAVLDGFSERKATILHQAFTGELTREWREKIGIGLDSWKDTILKEILDVRDGTHDSPQYHETGFPLITSKNLKNGKILEENLKFISKEDYDRINERSKVDSGDILFAMIGTIGNPTVIEKNPDFAIKNVALFKNINKVNVFFVKYYLESKRVVDKMTRESKGSTQRFVSLGYLRNFPIKTPTIEEQKEIVRVLDDIFAKESQSKATVESALAKIDTMKKAILATAFRGGFGTNDNSDESAEELLRKVL